MVKPRPQSDQNGVAAWTAAIARGDERALARMLSLIEARAPIALEVLRELYGRTGKAAVVGVTGAAGSGKSTLIAALAEEFRRRQKKIGILTVDPTSPLTGGALLGDRVRMRELFLDRGVFIRSLANRGHAGGVAGALHQSVQLLDAAGKEVILVETIGVGQDQVEIADIAETVVLLMTPESGDEVQAMKAGIIELADIFVINKADLPGAGALREKLLSVIDVGEEKLYLASATRRDGAGFPIPAARDLIHPRRICCRPSPQPSKKKAARFPGRPFLSCDSCTLTGDLRTSMPGAYLPAES